jgi:uncharacterized protein (TIGR03435 family)
MKGHERNSTQTLSRFLDRFFNPSNEQVEAAGDRVLQRLQAGTITASERVAVQPDSMRLKRRQWNVAMAFAGIAVMVTVLSVTLWQTINVDVVVSPVVFRSNSDGTVMTLADGSRIEMREGSEGSVEPVQDGLRIRLKSGSIIVTAAKQAAGRHLYVETRDVTVSVIGTVFLVKADDKGSRVAVIQGEVNVQQGTVQKNLRSGEQASSSAGQETLAMQVEIGWSREAAAYLALLHESVAQSLAARQSSPRTSSASDKPQFEEASIRSCEQNFQAPEGMRGGGSNSLRLSPRRLDALCMTVATLIRTAYRRLENNEVVPTTSGEPFSLNQTYGLGVEDGTRVRGGPEWMHLEKYAISAVAQGPRDAETLGGPMLLALLERRFQLRLHLESEEIPVWALGIAKGGLKMKPADPGSCFKRPLIRDEETWLRVEKERGMKTPCSGSIDGAPIVKHVAVGGTLPELATALSRASLKFESFGGPLSSTLGGLLVLDKTGIPDKTIFNYVLEYGGDLDAFAKMGLPPGDPTTLRGPTVFDALEQQLGLKLERGKGTREFIVIDHIEKPSPN